MSLLDKCKAILLDPNPENNETHSRAREAMNPLHPAAPIYERELPLVDTPAQDTHAQKFAAYHRAHPELYRAIEARALETAGRVSTKRIYEELRGKFPHLNNSYTADYADMLCTDHPEIEHRVERRRRAARKMRLVYAKN